MPHGGTDRLFEIGFSDRFARHLVAQVSNDRVTDEERERKLMDLRAAANVVLGRIDVAAGMQTHMHAAHDLSRSARRIVLLENLHGELQIPGEAGGRAHCKVLLIELQTEVDDFAGGCWHGRSRRSGVAAVCMLTPLSLHSELPPYASPVIAGFLYHAHRPTPPPF